MCACAHVRTSECEHVCFLACGCECACALNVCVSLGWRETVFPISDPNRSVASSSLVVIMMKRHMVKYLLGYSLHYVQCSPTTKLTDFVKPLLS